MLETYSITVRKQNAFLDIMKYYEIKSQRNVSKHDQLIFFFCLNHIFSRQINSYILVFESNVLVYDRHNASVRKYIFPLFNLYVFL